LPRLTGLAGQTILSRQTILPRITGQAVRVVAQRRIVADLVASLDDGLPADRLRGVNLPDNAAVSRRLLR
jgi:hypothetical protein